MGTVTIDNENMVAIWRNSSHLVDFAEDEKSIRTITRVLKKVETILPLIKAEPELEFTLVTEGMIENEFRKLNN